jgi:AcrR family transcriptional regulator
MAEVTHAPGVPRTRALRRDAELNRQRILGAAKEVFAERGLDATLDDVGRRAGLGTGTVYRRFPNKEALVEALFEERIEDLITIIDEALAKPDSWDGLVHLLERTCALTAPDRGLREVILCNAYGRDHVARARERLLPATEQVIARARDDGHVRTDFDATDVPLITLMLGSVAGYAADVRPEVWRRYLGLLLDGLRVRRDAPTPLPIPPLDDDEVDAAMSTWRPVPG